VTHVFRVCRLIICDVLSCSFSVGCGKESGFCDASGEAFLQFASQRRCSPKRGSRRPEILLRRGTEPEAGLRLSEVCWAKLEAAVLSGTMKMLPEKRKTAQNERLVIFKINNLPEKMTQR